MLSYTRAEEFVLDVRCLACHELTSGRGCRCSRDLTYSDSSTEVDEWLDTVPEADRKLALMAAGSALTRQRHRAGLREQPHPELPCSRDEDERAGFLSQHGLDTKWHPPSTKWTKRAMLDPI